jgi:hypothetical protein
MPSDREERRTVQIGITVDRERLEIEAKLLPGFCLRRRKEESNLCKKEKELINLINLSAEQDIFSPRPNCVRAVPLFSFLLSQGRSGLDHGFCGWSGLEVSKLKY